METKNQMPRRPRTCVYCGADGKLTREHVIPRSLFITMDPQMITVRACADCQREKGYGDDDLREFVNMDWAGSQHPDAPKQLEKIARATLINRSKLGDAFRRHGEPQALTSAAGLYFGDVWAIPIADGNKDMFRTLEYVVRGLYFHEMRQPLPPECPVVVQHIPALEAPALLARLREVPHRGPTIKGNLVAWWSSFHAEEDPLATAWLLVFNDRVYFLGFTGGPAQQRLDRRPAA